MGLVASEWTKLRTVRSTLWTLGILVVLGLGLSALACAETSSHWDSMAFVDRVTFDATRTSLIGIFFGQLVIGILGVLVVSAEYSTGTIRATFSAAPRRPLVIAAKVAVFGVVALVASEVAAFGSYLLGQALLTSPAPHTSISDATAFRAVFGSGVYLCLLGLFALGLATIIRHTAGAISAFVGSLLVLPLVVSALPGSIPTDVNRFLPAHIGSQIVSRIPDSDAFGAWWGVLLLGGYAAAAIAIGTALAVRRDA